MRTVFDIVSELEATRSRNEKQEILTKLSKIEQEQFLQVADRTYNPQINYWIKEFDFDYTCDKVNLTLEESLDLLYGKLARRSITGDAAREWVDKTYNSLNEFDAEIFKRVVKRDLRCGVSVKTVNKVWPNTIYDHPYMQCSSFNAKNLASITFPCYSQTKMDGLYIDIVVGEIPGVVHYYTRNGNIKYDFNGEYDKSLLEHFNGQVIMGEMVAVDDQGNLMDRQSSNGYLNSDEVDVKKLRFFAWDKVTLEEFRAEKSSVPYKERYESLKTYTDVNVVLTMGGRISLVDTVICNNKDDIITHLKRCLTAGEEGTVIKDFALDWKYGKAKLQIKCKVIFDCDLKVVGFKDGQGMHEGKLGALLCETSDGKLQVSVGGGFSNDQREEFMTLVDDWIDCGQIVVVRGNDVIKDAEVDSLHSIFLPRFVEVRFDKTEADTLERVQEQAKSFMDILDAIK